MRWLGAVVALGLAGSPALAGPTVPTGWFHRHDLDRVNRRLGGQVIDYTRNHGADRRIWSPALQQPRDLYVYVPPGFDPCRRYPLMLWLHGFSGDELSFLLDVVEPLDRAIASGQLPPLIIAAPDGSLIGRAGLFTSGSFFLNTRAGAFEDFVMTDVWDFVHGHYPIRPEPEAHVLAGASMGGGGAYNLAIKHRDRVKVVVGIFPPLNTRWMSCRGRYMANFDPCCWGWREDFRWGHEVVGRFYCVFTIRLKQVTNAIYDRRSPETLEEVSRENPVEMIDRLGLRPGELALYVGYGGRDQFNLDAQIESFLFVAKQHGLPITVGYEPNGRHDAATALKLLPGIVEWLRPLLEPYSPCGPLP
jgi:pimeloyl-ACP methyl ester carboxylesterase